jgi:hypothetical protein
MPQEFPVFINCRDRVSSLREMVDWLERAGQSRIYLVDNESTYPPLLDYYEATPHTVIKLRRNLGHKAIWESGVIDEYAAGEHYAATDPDIVPIEECPLDALQHFRAILDRYPDRAKVGFGLKIDDLPGRYRFAAEVRAWEGQFWTRELEPGIYDAPIDTTLALHRPGTDFHAEGARPEWAGALRTGHPYVARHAAWYVDSDNPDEEERYYRQHARADVTHWNVDVLPERLVEGMRNAGLTPRRRSFWGRVTHRD